VASRGRLQPGWQILALLLILGGIIGSFIGDAIVKTWPAGQVLGRMQNLGFAPFTLDLKVFSLTLGLMFHVSIFTLLGFLIAYVLYRKL
jgi:hypothetical protein